MVNLHETARAITAAACRAAEERHWFYRQKIYPMALRLWTPIQRCCPLSAQLSSYLADLVRFLRAPSECALQPTRDLRPLVLTTYE